jgi:GntR family transcriptional regulator
VTEPPDPRIYVRLANELREQIRNGTLPVGSPAPSITTLSQEHGTARATIGRAFSVLEAEGLVKRIPGLGYYVVKVPS